MRKWVAFCLTASLLFSGCTLLSPSSAQTAPPLQDSTNTNLITELLVLKEGVVSPVLYCYDPDTDSYRKTALEPVDDAFSLADLVNAVGNALGMRFQLRAAYVDPDGLTIVDFAEDSQPVIGVGSMAEIEALTSIAYTLLQNHVPSKQIAFRVEGNGYASGHFSFGPYEPYPILTAE